MVLRAEHMGAGKFSSPPAQCLLPSGEEPLGWYASSVELGASLCAKRSGRGAGCDIPTITVQKNGTYGDEGKAVERGGADGFAV
jgi:hypothetical protein